MTPIVLIPGLVCTAELFAPQIAALWPRGPVTVASTLGADSMEGLAADILAKAPPRFALAGLSMGGYAALEIMRQAPERVERLALLDTTARPDLPEQSEMRRGLIDQARSGAYGKVLAQTMPNLVHPSRRNDRALIEKLIRMGKELGPEVFARQQTAIIGRADSRPHLAAITVPTLCLVGDKDVLTPPDRAEEMAAAIPNARLAIIPEAGHVSTLEQPEAVNAALLEWLDA